MKIIYPYPMHISNGYTYMLSIIQFLNTLAEIVTVELLCLDSREDIKDYLKNNLNVDLHSNLKVITISNKKFGIKSNKLFFIGNVLKYLKQYKSDKLVVYTRDFKQIRLAIKNLKGKTSNIKFVFEVHQILSQNYCREGEYKKAKEMKELEDFGKWEMPSPNQIRSVLSRHSVQDEAVDGWVDDYEHYLNTNEIRRVDEFIKLRDRS